MNNKPNITDIISCCRDCRLAKELRYQYGEIYGYECSITTNTVADNSEYPLADSCPLSEDRPFRIDIYLRYL